MRPGLLHYLSITEAGALMRSGALSPVDLTRHCLERIAALDTKLHAFITLTADQALREAEQAQEELRSGRDRGPLHGIPIAHKDIVCTRGVRTTAHSNLLRDWVPEEDATVYTRLREAGAISLGKLGLWEFAFGNPGPTVAFPPPRNPWNTDYSPGGSSSGSGAAVAAGLCFGATGTDTGGSIRHPAGVCGIVGMKPTFGRVSVHGVLPLAKSLDHVGPMTRTVRDNALMLQAMAGADSKDATSSVEPVPRFDALMGQDIAGMTLGVPRRFIDSVPHEPECLAVFDRALEVLSGLGVKLVDFDMPSLHRTMDVGVRLLIAEAYEYHRENLHKHPEKFDLSLRTRVLQAQALSPQEIDEARELQQQLKDDYARLFRDGMDVIVSPAREGISDTMAALTSDVSGRRSSSTRMYNLSGMPCLVMPMGFGRHGMLLGIQFAASHFQEQRLYQLAAAYESATGWTGQRPPLP